jgi:hypothetical protein
MTQTPGNGALQSGCKQARAANLQDPVLAKDGSLFSACGQYQLIPQQDGNLVISGLAT